MSDSPVAPETAFLIDFNCHWVPSALGLNVNPAAGAAMLGISEAQFRAYAAAVAEQVNQTATELLARPAVAAAIDRLPVPHQGKLMAIGDSITTYRFGYTELLRAMLALRRPEDGLQLVNAGQSGYTTTHGLEVTYTQFLAQQPDLVLVMYGVNDCKHFGSRQARTLVSAEEYRANLAAIVAAFAAHTPAQVIVLTPTPVVERIVNSNPDFAAIRMTWSNADLEERAGIVRDLAQNQGLPLVDLVAAFGPDPDPGLYLADGLHPGPAGHRLIVQSVLEALSTSLS